LNQTNQFNQFNLLSKMTFAKINGINIHYQYEKAPIGGVGATFVFINSLGTDFRIWDGVVEHLGNQGNILRYDKRGHGLSENSPNSLTISDLASDVIALLDYLKIEKVVLVGLSIGGIIGQYLAINSPERIEKLVLSNTAPRVGSEESWNTRINIVENKGIASIADAIMKVWFSENFHQNHAPELAAYKTMLSNINPVGYVHACEALRENDLTDEISKINIPTLCLAGTEDGSTPPAQVKAMADQIPDAEYVLIEGVGHIPCVEKPQFVSSKILEFVSEKSTNLYEQGMKTRRSVLGDAHVDKAEANKTDFDKDFQEYITNSAWGSIWSRPHLTKRERSMITIAILTALGLEEELAMHIRATKNTGATQEDVKEVLMHTGVYAGVPRTNGAMKIAKAIYSPLAPRCGITDEKN
jgi:3-oxoadipate enol-lactonase / 4-carboxymuconolactone decarboxylase